MVGYTSNGYYRGKTPGMIWEANGTSLSSPIVAGVAVLVTSKWPSLWPQMVRYRIDDTATKDLPDPTVNQFGRVNADDAL
jgi:subtilisin family serine protease